MSIKFTKLFSTALLAASLPLAANAQSIKTVISFPNPTSGISVNPVTDLVYVVAPSDNGGNFDSVAVIDGKKDAVIKSIQVPVGAAVVAVDYFRNLVYVAGCNPYETPAPCIVSVIDGNSNKIVRKLSITSTPGFGLIGIAANPLTGQIFIANANDNVINVWDGLHNKMLRSVDLGGNVPNSVAVNPFTNRLYVPFGTSQTAVIDSNTKEVLSTTTFGMDTVGVALNFLTGNVFVTDEENGPSTTGVFDQNGKVLATVPVGNTPLGVDVDPITNLAFVVNTAFQSVTVIDGSNNTVKANVFGIPASFDVVNFLTEKVYLSGTNGVTVLTEK